MTNEFLSNYDVNNTYFEYNFISKKIPTIFIHGVGLDNTMWYPQKNTLKIIQQFIMIYLIMVSQHQT